MKATIRERIERSVVVDGNGCWIWQKSRTTNGYAKFRAHGTGRGHRAVYIELRGPIPTGLQLDHLCRVPLCVNPDHLEPVTNRTNSLRGVGLTAVYAARTACDRGHEFDLLNTRFRTDGSRRCRKCSALDDRNRALRRKSRTAQAA